MAERLGEVPVAVLEKGKQPGSHLLSGAVVEPEGAAPPLRRTLPDGGSPVVRPGPRRVRLRPHAPGRAADPAAAADAEPRQLDLLALPARPLPRRARGGGRRDDPPRDRGAEAPRLARPRGGRPHRRQGPQPRGRRARQLRGRLRPRGQGHGARGGDAGSPHRRRARPVRPARRGAAGVGARREGGLEGREAARPRHPHDGLAAAHGQALPRVRRLVHLPDGRGHGHDRPRRRARLPRRVALGARPAAGAEDAPEDPEDPGGRRARGVGREDDPERRLPLAAAASCTRRACSSAATASGMVNVPRLKGIHYAIESGRLAAEAAFRALQRGETPASALSSYDDAVRDSFIWQRPVRGAEHAPGLRARLLRRRRARERDDDVEGSRRAREDAGRAGRRPAAARHRPGQRATRRPTASSPSTSSRRSSPRATRRATTSRTTSGSSGACRARSRSSGRTCARRRCTRSGGRTATARSWSTSLRRTASSAARSRPRAAASRRPRAAPGPSTR